MLSDLVVDTNVLVQASDPNNQYFESSEDFLNILLIASTVLKVDDGFSPDRARNGSIIMNEYLDHLRAGTLGYAVIQTLAAKERIKGVERTVGEREAKKIRQEVRDKSDRIFVKVALNTEEHVLVSHDFTHFTLHVRSSIDRDIGVTIIDCMDACPRLS